MNFTYKQLPSPALQPFIERFAVMEFATPLRDSHLPHTGAVAAFSFRGECVIDNSYVAPPAAFTGLYETIRRHEHRNNHAVLLVTFTSIGASAFSRIPLRSVSAGTTSLETLGIAADTLNTLQIGLNTAANHVARVALVETFLLQQLRISAPDPLVAAALQWLKTQAGQSRIRDLTQHIGLSQSALERRFHQSVGVSPKKFAMLVRLQRAIRLKENGIRTSTIAHAAGYFDHSHFINDFQRITGNTPEAYFNGTGSHAKLQHATNIR